MKGFLLVSVCRSGGRKHIQAFCLTDRRTEISVNHEPLISKYVCNCNGHITISIQMNPTASRTTTTMTTNNKHLDTHNKKRKKRRKKIEQISVSSLFGIFGYLLYMVWISFWPVLYRRVSIGFIGFRPSLHRLYN